MRLQIIEKDLKSTHIVILAYFALALLYFSNAIFDGLLIAYWDGLTFNYPMRLYYSSFIKDGISLWLPYEFAGISFLGHLQTGLLYPLNFIYFFLPAAHAYNLSIIIHFTLAAVFTFLYVRLLGINAFPAFIAGIIFGFSGFVMGHGKEHTSMTNAAVWLPSLLYLYEKIRLTLDWKYVIWSAIIITVQIFAGYFQACVMYTYLVLAFFIVFFFIKENSSSRIRFLLFTITPIILGFIMASPQLLATKEFSDMASRATPSYDLFTSGSFPPYMLPILIFPFIFGGGYSLVPYFGVLNLTEMTGFTGIMPLVMAGLALIKYKLRNIHVVFWGVVALFSLLLTLGGFTPLSRLMYQVPVYNLFRIPARNLLVFDLAVSVLCAFGINYFVYTAKEVKKNFYLLVGGILLVSLGGIVFLLLNLDTLSSHLVMTGTLSPQQAELLIQSFNLSNPALLVPVMFMIAYLIWTILLYKQALGRNELLLGLTVLIFVEALSFGAFHANSWQRIEDVNSQSTNSILTALKSRVGHERVLFVRMSTWPLYNVPVKLNVLNGYDPLIPHAFEDILSMGMNGETPAWKDLLGNNIILSMLNTRYIVMPSDSVDISQIKTNNLNSFSLTGETLQPYAIVFNQNGTQIVENRNCLPRAFSVENIRSVTGLNEVKNTLNSPDFNPLKTALLSAEDIRKLKQTSFKPGTVTVREYGSDSILIDTDFEDNGFIILSDQYCPGWIAQIDGKKTPIYQVNGFLRGITIPAGQHVVTFKYAPIKIYLALIVSGLLFVGCISALFISSHRSRSRKKTG